MKKSEEELFSSVQTLEQLVSALAKRLDSRDLTTAEMKAVEFMAEARGWIVGKTPKSAPAEESATAKPKPPDEEPPW